MAEADRKAAECRKEEIKKQQTQSKKQTDFRRRKDEWLKKSVRNVALEYLQGKCSGVGAQQAQKVVQDVETTEESNVGDCRYSCRFC